MAVRFDASGEALTRTASLPSSTAFTMCGWAKRAASTSTWTFFAGLENATSSSTKYMVIGYRNNGPFCISSDTGGTAAQFGTTYGDGVWFFWAISNAGTGATDFKGYAMASTESSFQTVTETGSSFTAAMMPFGNDSYNERFNGTMAGLRVWDAVLTQAELEQERYSILPVRMANLHGFWPIFGHSDLVDYSGNARDLTATGTLSTEDGPPVSWVAPIQLVGNPTSGAQTITPNGLASAEAFGTAKIVMYLSLSGLASGEAFGTAKVNRAVAPSAIPSAEAFGSSKLNFRLTPSGLASAEAFGTINMAQDVVLSPSAIASAEAFGASKLNLRLLLSAIASGEAFGTSKLNFTLKPGAISSGEAFGSHVVSSGFIISVSGIASAEAFGTGKIQLYLLPGGISSAEAFGSARLVKIVSPGGIASAEAFGTSKLGFVLKPSSIASAQAFGDATVSAGGTIISLGGISSLEAFGTGKLNRTLPMSGIASAEAFGSTRFVIYVRPSGIATVEAFGTQSVQRHIAPAGIASAQAFGSTVVKANLAIPGVASGEAFGSTVIVPGPVTIIFSGIPSAELLGAFGISNPGPGFGPGTRLAISIPDSLAAVRLSSGRAVISLSSGRKVI